MPAGGARAAADDDEDDTRAAGDEEEEEEDHSEDAEGEGSVARPKPTRADKNALSSLVPNATGWHLMRMAEGVLQPAEEVSTKLEHEGKKKPYMTRERCFMLKKSLVRRYKADSFAVPPEGDVRGADRLKNSLPKPYARAPLEIRQFRNVMVKELEDRSFSKVKDESTFMCFKLNPTMLKKMSKWLSESEIEQADAVFDRHFNRVANMLEAKLGSSSGPSRGSAPSPVRAEQGAAKRAKVTRSVEDDMDACSGDDDDDDDDEGDEEDVPSISRALELERFKQIGKRDIARATDKSGKFDVLLFWTLNKDTFPIMYILALVFYGTLCTEANCERIFKFSGMTLSPLRTRLGPLILQAFVFVAHNEEFFSITDDELYEQYQALGSKPAYDAAELGAIDEADAEDSDGDGGNDGSG